MTAGFLSKLRVEELDDDRHLLLEDLVFYSAELDQDDSDMAGGIIIAPAGSITNYASVPAPFEGFFPKVKRESTMHDGAYGGTLLNELRQVVHLVKTLADNLFREAMRVNPRVSDYDREVMYRAVRRFGGRAYRGLGHAANS